MLPVAGAAHGRKSSRGNAATRLGPMLCSCRLRGCAAGLRAAGLRGCAPLRRRADGCAAPAGCIHVEVEPGLLPGQPAIGQPAGAEGGLPGFVGAVAANLMRAAGPHWESHDLGILLASDETTAALNLEYRGRDQPTDVLSFATGRGGCFDGGEVSPPSPPSPPSASLPRFPHPHPAVGLPPAATASPWVSLPARCRVLPPVTGGAPACGRRRRRRRADGLG